MTHETWGGIRENLIGRIGRNHYVNWIKPLEFASLENGVVTFHVPTQFMGTWIERHFSNDILTELTESGASVSRVRFEVSPRAAQVNGASALAVAAMAGGDSEPAEDGGALGEDPENGLTADGPLPGARLNPLNTFDTFVVGKPNELAHAAARRVAAAGPVSFTPLFLHGGVGLGKTHLMHAIAWELRRGDPALRVIYLSAEQFMYRFIQALRDKDTISFKQMFRSVDVLMVDDIQFLAGKDQTQEEFFHTFNALIDENRQIVLSADRAPSDIQGIEDRIASRMQSGLVVDLHPTNYELRLGILQQNLSVHAREFPGLTVDPGVLEFVAHKISTDVRTLDGALRRLMAVGGLVGQKITVELAQDCLSDLIRTSDRKVSTEEIQRKVADHYNIRLSDLIGPKRHRSLARPRQVAMYLAKKLTSRSLPEIGRRFGGRDHTTVMYGVKRIEELKVTDHQIAEDLEILRRALEA